MRVSNCVRPLIMHCTIQYMTLIKISVVLEAVSEWRQGVSWITSKDYITIKQAIKHTITWAHKAWVKLIQLGTSWAQMQLVLPEAICYYPQGCFKIRDETL